MKKTVKQASNTTLEQGLTYERDLSLSLTSTSAFKEGVSAFFQKENLISRSIDDHLY